MKQKAKQKINELSFSEKVYSAVKRIPRGKVATYGQVAAAAGNGGAARAVGNALHKNPAFGEIPCPSVATFPRGIRLTAE